MHAEDVVEVVDLLEDAGIAVWVDGGWGIDALIGEQSRPHDDLDVVIDIQQVAEAITWMEACGFTLHQDQRPTAFVLRDALDRRVDVHPVRFAVDGSGSQAQPDGSMFRYSPEGLSGTGTIGDRPVRCLSAGFQVTCHLSYEPDDGDFHDMHLLRDRLGVKLPSPYDT